MYKELQTFKERWMEARAAYLELAHVREDEVQTDWEKRQYFMFDGTKVLMPQELSTLDMYKRFAQGL